MENIACCGTEVYITNGEVDVKPIRELVISVHHNDEYTRNKIRELVCMYNDIGNGYYVKFTIEGFMTNKGNFVEKPLAYKLALLAKQICGVTTQEFNITHIYKG